MAMTADERQRWKARMRRLESGEELSEGTPAQRAKAVADRWAEAIRRRE